MLNGRPKLVEWHEPIGSCECELLRVTAISSDSFEPMGSNHVARTHWFVRGVGQTSPTAARFLRHEKDRPHKKDIPLTSRRFPGGVFFVKGQDRFAFQVLQDDLELVHKE